jgi:hypothetical protein
MLGLMMMARVRLFYTFTGGMLSIPRSEMTQLGPQGPFSSDAVFMPGTRACR